jgi:hypothetical protein
MVAVNTFILGQPPNFQNFFVMGQSKRLIAKNKKNNSDLGRHSKTNFHIDHAIQFYMTNIQQFETFWLAFKIQLRVVGPKKEGGKRERYSGKKTIIQIILSFVRESRHQERMESHRPNHPSFDGP